MTDQDHVFVEVAVALPLFQTFFYKSSTDFVPHIGARVLVRLGSQSIQGVVVDVVQTAPSHIQRFRNIDSIIDSSPMIYPEVIKLCRWISDYYHAPFGEVLRLALPVGSTMTIDATVSLTNEQYSIDAKLNAMDKKVLHVVETLKGKASLKILKKHKIPMARLNRLVTLGLLTIDTKNCHSRVQEKTSMVAVLQNESQAIVLLKRALKRRAVFEQIQQNEGRIEVSVLKNLIPNASSHLRNLVKDGLVKMERKKINRNAWEMSLKQSNDKPETKHCLNKEQQKTFDSICHSLDEFKSFLIYGVTGSGKTEVYLHLIEKVLQHGKCAIILVPEISLTPQLSMTFYKRFGDDVALLHSGLSDGERFDQWYRLKEGKARIALGTRSAIYAPLTNIGIIIVDEEHDSSFKQDTNVRYHGRDVALMRAKHANIPCVLGSATPSIETYHWAQTGRYQMLTLKKRATASTLPHVDVIDLKRFYPNKESMITAPLDNAIRGVLKEKGQVILLLNRRGFSTFILCSECGYVDTCPDCCVSLTYHQHRDQTICHYCDYACTPKTYCDSCNKNTMIRKGIGTEKLMEGVTKQYPDATIERLDKDSSKGTKLHDILNKFQQGTIDILVGTQIVAKGHDFPNVLLAAVLCADMGLSLPDFRATERVVQLLTQISGRSGRSQRGGNVMLQTYNPQSSWIQAVKQQNYESFFHEEINERKQHLYPPFSHLILIRIEGDNEQLVQTKVRLLNKKAILLKKTLNTVLILGPSEAPLRKLRGKTRWHLWLRCPTRPPLHHFAHALIDKETQKGLSVYMDVDPVSLL